MEQEFLNIDIKLYIDNENLLEYYPSIKVRVNSKKDLNLYQILQFFLKAKLISKDDAIYYWNEEQRYFVYSNRFLNDPEHWIPHHSIRYVENKNPMISMLYRRLNKSPIKIEIPVQQLSLKSSLAGIIAKHLLGQSQEDQIQPKFLESISTNYTTIEVENVDETILEDEQEERLSREKRNHRQRTLYQVLELVDRWRYFYKGYFDTKLGVFVKMNLNEAAEKLGVPKKSLDDYLLIINQGKYLGFDFEMNQNQCFDELRRFVKNKKKIYKTN